MSAWPLPDPSPDDDLPSDVEFGTWLASQHPLIVIADREAGMRFEEKRRLHYIRYHQRELGSRDSFSPPSGVEGTREES